MEAKIKRKPFAQALSAAALVADKKSTMPIMASALIEVGEQGVTVSSTDLMISVVTSIPASEKKSGSLAVGAANFHTMVNGLSEEEVRIRLVEGNRLELKSGKSVYKIPGSVATAFPKLPPTEFPWEKVEAKAFAMLLRGPYHAIGVDFDRLNLTGLLLVHHKEGTAAVSTDGHRLACMCRPGKMFKEGNLIIPRKGVKEILTLLGVIKEVEGGAMVEVGVKFPHFAVRSEGTTLVTKMLDVKFPPWTEVVPKDRRSDIPISRKQLLDAVTRIGLFTDSTNGTISLTFTEGKISLAANTVEVGEGVEEIEADYDGKRMTIGLSERYLREALVAVGGTDDLSLDIGTEMDPVVLYGGNDACVIMPMRA